MSYHNIVSYVSVLHTYFYLLEIDEICHPSEELSYCLPASLKVFSIFLLHVTSNTGLKEGAFYRGCFTSSHISLHFSLSKFD